MATVKRRLERTDRIITVELLGSRPEQKHFSLGHEKGRVEKGKICVYERINQNEYKIIYAGRKTNTMKNLQLILFILIIFSLLISGCLQKDQGVQKNNSVQESYGAQKTPKTLSESQIRQFLAEKNVTPLAIRNIEDSTVILYETQLEMGIYRLSTDENDNMSLAQISWKNNSAFTPVSIGGTGAGTPFVTVIINDDQILKKAYKVTVVFANKDEVTEMVNNNKGIIIPDENIRNANVGWSSVTIFDEDGSVLFNKV